MANAASYSFLIPLLRTPRPRYAPAYMFVSELSMYLSIASRPSSRSHSWSRPTEAAAAS